MPKNINEKIIDDLIESGFDLYIQDIYNEDDTLPPEVEKTAMESKERIRRRLQKEIQKSYPNQKKRHSRRILRKSLLVAIVFVSLFAIMINVSAFRIFIYKTYVNMQGSVLSVQTDRIYQQYETIQKFANKNELIIPNWLPPGTNLQIQDNGIFVKLDYETETGDFYLRLSERVITQGGAKTNLETEQNEYTVEDCNILGMEGKIVYIKSEAGHERYTVVWNSDTTSYELSTNATGILFETIMNDLTYYKK